MDFVNKQSLYMYYSSTIEYLQVFSALLIPAIRYVHVLVWENENWKKSQAILLLDLRDSEPEIPTCKILRPALFFTGSRFHNFSLRHQDSRPPKNLPRLDY